MPSRVRDRAMAQQEAGLGTYLYHGCLARGGMAYLDRAWGYGLGPANGTRTIRMIQRDAPLDIDLARGSLIIGTCL